MIAPLLKPNGLIGICSPSHVAQFDEYQKTLSAIRQHGFRTLESDNLYKNTYGYLASPQERADDLNQLAAHPNVELILFGGGEGANELLPYINFENIKKHPKRFLSFSDGTTLLGAIYAKTGLETYYGQAPYLFDQFSSYDQKQFMDHMVLGAVSMHKPVKPWQVQTKGVGEGILIGGYARNFAMLLGSRYFPIDLKQKYLLLIEDHKMFGDVSYVSAMLSHIEQHDLIHQVTGLIFGHYSEITNPELLKRIQRFGETYGIPTVYCDDFGHGENHAIFPLGRRARLDTTQGGSLCYL